MTTTLEPASVNKVTRRVARALMYATGTRTGDLAALLHIGRTTLATRLNGEVPFTLDEVAVMARYYGQPLAAFTTGNIDLAALPEALSMYFDVAADLALYDAEAVSVA